MVSALSNAMIGADEPMNVTGTPRACTPNASATRTRSLALAGSALNLEVAHLEFGNPLLKTGEELLLVAAIDATLA